MKEIELLEKRKFREKHFLQEDGNIKVKIYDQPIHYIKEGKYHEIDNSLIRTKECWENKSNAFKIKFGESSDKIFCISKDDYFISLRLNNNTNKHNINVESNTKIFFKNIVNGIDLSYQIIGNKIKELITIKNNLVDIDDLNFHVDTNLRLKYNDDGSISALDGDNIVFKIESPYIIDKNGEIHQKVKYFLDNDNGIYNLKYIIDKSWLEDKNRTFPIYIDPTIITNNDQVYDTFISSLYPNQNMNNYDIIKVGNENVNNQSNICRGLIKFDLPDIPTGSQIIDARLVLIGYPIEVYNAVFEALEVHKVNNSWNESSVTWNSFNNCYDNRVEACFDSSRSLIYSQDDIQVSENSFDITNLVKKWYTDEPNYGVLIKSIDESAMKSNIPAFFSKNNLLDSNPQPLIEITYRDQNGLEQYMKYFLEPLSIGNIYFNILTGNITFITSLSKTDSLTIPMKLDLIYNTNDNIINSNYNSLPKGYKFNLNQMISKVQIDNKYYLKYTDEDGTVHYYSDTKIIIDDNDQISHISENNTFYDEDGLNSKIIEYNDKYEMIDIYNTKLVFIKYGEIAYLQKIVDQDGNEGVVTLDSLYRISKLTDSDGNEINITYNSNQILISNSQITYSLNISNNEIISVISSLGTLNVASNSLGLIDSITDVNGLKIKLYYYDNLPYKVKKIEEYSIENELGKVYNFYYSRSATSIVDPFGKTNTFVYNNRGNTISSSLKETNGLLKNSYGVNCNYIEEYQYINKEISHSFLVRTVENYMKNSSFEDSENIFNKSDINNIDIQISTDYSRSGYKSMKIINNAGSNNIYTELCVPKGSDYTFSAYVKNNCNLSLELSYLDDNNNLINSISNIININDEFSRYNVSINYPLLASSNLKLKINANSSGIIYIDDIQLESGLVCNEYNYLDQSIYENLETEWNLSDEERFSIVDCEGNKAIKIDMDPSVFTSMDKEITLKGLAGDTYTICFWYKNKGIKSDIPEYYNNVIVSFDYELEEEYEGHHAFPSCHLNPNEDEWQFFMEEFTAEYNYNSIILSFFQEYDANELYLANISLFKGSKINVKHYNDNGMIDSNISCSGVENIVGYDEVFNKNYVKNIINNAKIVYENDKNTNNLINTINSLGMTTNYKYNVNNDITCVQDKYISHELQNSKLYSIRCAGSEKYIKLKNKREILIDLDINNIYSWKFEKIVVDNDTFYRICHPFIFNTYLTCNVNEIVLSNYQNDLSLFEIIKNDNDSSYIKNKSNGKYLQVINNNLTLSDNLINNKSFEFYIEDKSDKCFTETTYKYINNKLLDKKISTNLIETKYNYNIENGLLQSVFKNQKEIVSYVYDILGRVTKYKKRDKFIEYLYNNDNTINEIHDGDKIYRITYNNFLDRENLYLNNNLLSKYYYDLNNNNLTSVQILLNHLNFFYDNFGRIIKKIKNDIEYKYYYDNYNNIARIIAPNFDIEYYYDGKNQLIKIKQDNFEVNLTYDNYNRLIAKHYRLNNQNFNEYFEYDFSNSLVQLQFGNDVFNYSYDKLGRLEKVDFNNFTMIKYNYIKNGYRESYNIKNEDILSDKYEYKYNGNEIISIYKNNKKIKKYLYNEYDELKIEKNYLNNTCTKYSYDKYGNMLKKIVYKLDTNEFLRQDLFEYNNSDACTKVNDQSIVYDNIGNPVQYGSSISLTWSKARELSNYIDLNKNISINYQYDDNGNRISKTINNDETLYYYEKNNLILETSNNRTIFFIRNSDGLLLGFTYNNNNYYYLKDINNNIVGIIDSNNNLIGTYEYNAWGEILSINDANGYDVSNLSNNIMNINPIRYKEYYYDKETQLYYLSKRYYSAKLCRFINPDVQISSDIFGKNLYLYCANNPVMRIDMSGDFWMELLVIAVCAVVNGGEQVISNIYNF